MDCQENRGFRVCFSMLKVCEGENGLVMKKVVLGLNWEVVGVLASKFSAFYSKSSSSLKPAR